MPHDQVVIGYSPRTGARRTVSVLDYPWQVPVHAAWMKSMGEAVLIGTLSDYRTIGPDAMLARHLGRAPLSSRCAVIDYTGRVVAVVLGDPHMGDSHPLGRLHGDPDGRAVVGQLARDLGLLP